MLSGGSTVIKYLLFLFNALFVVTGIVLLSVGAVVKGVYWNYHHFLDDKYFSTPNLLIAVGSIILLVSFLGCCGAFKENYCMILSFVVLLILIFILELSGGIAGYVLRDKAADVLQASLSESMTNYNRNDSKEITVIFNTVQRTFDCCGVMGPEDWKRVMPPANGTTDVLLPWSCCRAPLNSSSSSTSCSLSDDLHFKDGCVDKLGEYIKQKAAVLGGWGLGIAFIQLLGIVLACRLAGAMKRSEHLMPS